MAQDYPTAAATQVSTEAAILRRLLDELWPLTGGMDELDTVFARACQDANYWPPACLAYEGDDND